jgi:hypothetical protein
MKRITILLTSAEMDQFRRIKPEQGKAWDFWRRVADVRDCDYRTLFYRPGAGGITALPTGHKKHWCYPEPLECKRSVST